MFADDLCVYRSGIDVEVLAQQMTKASRIESGPTQKPVSAKARISMPAIRMEHVHWIGCDEDDAVGIVSSDLGHDLAEDFVIAFHQDQAASHLDAEPLRP